MKNDRKNEQKPDNIKMFINMPIILKIYFNKTKRKTTWREMKVNL